MVVRAWAVLSSATRSRSARTSTRSGKPAAERRLSWVWKQRQPRSCASWTTSAIQERSVSRPSWTVLPTACLLVAFDGGVAVVVAAVAVEGGLAAALADGGVVLTAALIAERQTAEPADALVVRPGARGLEAGDAGE